METKARVQLALHVPVCKREVWVVDSGGVESGEVRATMRGKYRTQHGSGCTTYHACSLVALLHITSSGAVGRGKVPINQDMAKVSRILQGTFGSCTYLQYYTHTIQ